MGLLLIGYSLHTRANSLMLALALASLLCGMSLIFPWRVRGQVVVAGGALLGFSIKLLISPTPGVAPLYQLFAALAAAAVSLLGAHYLQLPASLSFARAG
jgi:phosphate/sulfate permease